MLKRIEPDALLRDKLVMVALPGAGDWVGAVRKLGAKDVLLLTRNGPQDVTRHPTHVEKRYAQLSDVRNSNSEVGILNERAIGALFRKRYFWHSRFETLLVPLSGRLLLGVPFALHYARRQFLAIAGITSISTTTATRSFLVLRLRRAVAHYRRLFAPAHLQPVEMMGRIQGVNYVLLRAIEAIERNESFKDIDILVSDADLPRLRERLGQEVGTFPIDVYSETGGEGHDFNSAPYFVPELARQMLRTAALRPSGVRAASATSQYLSLIYHLIFHAKTRHLDGGTKEINADTWGKAAHYSELKRLAQESGLPVPRTFSDLDEVLRAHRAFPGRDLIGFYARRNPFVETRYVKSERKPAGLATFFVRDFGDGAHSTQWVLEQLEKQFTVLAHGSLNDENRSSVINMVRGGNWHDPARDMMAEPAYWFVCWDERPLTPTGRPRRKYPNLDNQHVAEFKHRIRAEAGKIVGDPTRLLHASDNTDEAIEHIDAIGIREHPDVFTIVSRLEHASRGGSEKQRLA